MNEYALNNLDVHDSILINNKYTYTGDLFIT